MPKAKHKDFSEFSELGQSFIKFWNKQNKDGAQVRVAEKFKISVASVYRIRKKLGLAAAAPGFEDPLTA